MNKIALLPVCAAFVSISIAVVGCPGFVDGCDFGPCGSDGSTTDGTLPDVVRPDTSIPDGNGPDSEPPPGCTTPDEPLKNPEKCLVDAFGAYVSPTGDDANPGTKARPFKTIAKALGTTQARVVVCEGSYAESVEIVRDVSILSGIDCAFSKAGAKAKITGVKAEFAVSIAKPASAVQLRDVEIEAIDGTSASVNSIALLVSEVASVKLVGVSATAKKGFDEPKGDDGTGGLVGEVGKDAVGSLQGGPTSKTCNGTATIGGGGGGGGDGADGHGQNGGPAGIAENPAGANGRGDMSGNSICPLEGLGKGGARPVDALHAAMATSRGALTASWLPTKGNDAATGGPGQGGVVTFGR